MWTSNRSRRSRLSALAGLFLIASVIGAARPRPTTGLTITPAAHNFGPVVVAAQGTIFEFTIALPPGGAPTDAVSAKVTGPNAGDFLVTQKMKGGLTGGVRPYTTCTTATWRTGSCTFGVEFIPLSTGVKNATLTVSDTRGNVGTATLTGIGIFGCTMYEGICNYAANYSGSFSWKSTVNALSDGYTSAATVNVDVTIKNGVVLCGGGESGTAKWLTGSRLDRMKQSTGVVSGPGLLVVEFKDDDNGKPAYQITASCPSANITETTTDYLSNTTGTGTSPAKPVTWSDRTSMDPAPASAIGIDLVGTQSGPHAEEDPGNGVTGTMTFTWSLKRI